MRPPGATRDRVFRVLSRSLFVFYRASLCPCCIALAIAASSAGAQTAAETPAPRGLNPRISLMLQGTYADFSSDAAPAVGGVLLGPETELRPGGFSLAETELVVESNVDDRFHAWATIAFENEDGETVVAVEEAYVDTIALPAGFAIKAGRFFSDIGYQNRIHSHAWDFVDMPLPYRALLANQVKDDGVQLRWVAPIDLFWEIGAEALRGAAYPGGGDGRRGARAFAGFTRWGGDIGASHSWRFGVSHLATDATDRRTHEDLPVAFSGESGVGIVDLVYKWAPDGNPAQRSFVLNAEVLLRREQGGLVFDPEGAAVASDYEGEQAGFYLQGVWQFVPRWRVGARYDRLDLSNAIASNPGGAFDALLDPARAPQRASVMADFSNSEFSRLRVQYTRDKSRPDEEDNQFFLQYIMSIGAHPAHQF